MASDAYGKRGVCPCGAPGEYIIAQFLQCSRQGCDGRPRCPHCSSGKVEPFESALTPPGSLHCWDCGRVYYRP